MATYVLYTASYGSTYANDTVKIFDQNNNPAIVMASATGGVLSRYGIATLDGSGNLSVYLDSTVTPTVAVFPVNQGATASSSNTQETTQLLVKTAVQTIATNSATEATAANQTTANTSLATIATNTTGVATAANQTTGNGSLSTIATRTPALGTAAMAASSPVTIATDDTQFGATATAYTPGTGASGLKGVVSDLVIAQAAGTKLIDSAGTTKATIKAGSTAVAQTDTSLVVQTLINGLVQGTITLSGSTTTGASLVAFGIPASVGELSSISLAAASGTSAVVNPNNGISSTYVLNINVFTAGASTGLDAVLQYSIDGQTTWLDAWHFDRITTTGSHYTPALSIAPFPHRINFVNQGGAATTVTASLIAVRLPAPAPVAYKYIDRTAALITNPAQNAVGSTFRIFSAKVVTIYVVVGTAATPGVYAIQVSPDGTNWSTATNAAGTAASVTAVANSTVQVSAVGVTGSYVRIIQTAASVSQTGTQITITALG